MRRNRRGAFGGMWVFPGGQVDGSDRSDRPGEIDAARRAAVREAQEEAGLTLDEESLVTLSFWLPPPEAPRRFATWFFLARAGSDEVIEIDRSEIHEHQWLTPAAAMALRDDGRIELAPPTFTTLWWLSAHDRVTDAIDAAAARAPERFETHVAVGHEGKLMATLWAGDAGYEDRDADKPGPRRRLVMDPAGWRVEISA